MPHTVTEQEQPDWWPSSADHEWIRLWELWRRAGWNSGVSGTKKKAETAGHSAHTEDKDRISEWISKELAAGLPTWVSSKFPDALQKDDDGPEHQPPEAPLHLGTHTQVEFTSQRSVSYSSCVKVLYRYASKKITRQRGFTTSLKAHHWPAFALTGLKISICLSKIQYLEQFESQVCVLPLRGLFCWCNGWESLLSAALVHLFLASGLSRMTRNSHFCRALTLCTVAGRWN